MVRWIVKFPPEVEIVSWATWLPEGPFW